MVLLQCSTASWIELSESKDLRQLSTLLVLGDVADEKSAQFFILEFAVLCLGRSLHRCSFWHMGRRKSRYFWKNCLDNRRQLLKGGLDDCRISFWATEVEGVVGMESEEASHASMLLLGLKKRGTRKPLEMSSSACTIANGESEIGRSKLKSWGTLKNLFEGESFGSISMKEASSSEREALKELSRLSKDGFRFTSQL